MSSIHVACSGFNHHVQALYGYHPLITTALAQLSGQLRSLCLATIPYLTVDAVLSPSLVLPQLEHFSIRYFLAVDSRDRKDPNAKHMNTIQNAVTPFINRHRLTVRSLEIIVPADFYGNNDLIPLFSNLICIQNLELFSVGVGATSIPALSKFIEVHALSLRSIKVVGCASSALRLLKDNLTSFPQLASLAGELYDAETPHKLPITYLCQYAPTLSRLHIHGKLLQDKDLRLLLSTSWVLLEEFEVGVSLVTTETFDSLTGCLPLLKFLVLRVARFGKDYEVSLPHYIISSASLLYLNIVFDKLFCAEMKARRYHSIHLRHLTVQFENASRTDAYQFGHCMSAIAKAFTTVDVLNNKRREEHLVPNKRILFTSAITSGRN